MQLLFTKEFEKGIRKIKNKRLALSVEEAIVNVKEAANISSIRNLKKLKNHSSA